MMAGARLVAVPVDEEGLDVEAGIARCPRPRAVYVTPSHQLPLGMTMSASRRLQLLDWARHRGVWIIEDDYDGEYRYGNLPIASLQGLDRDSRVIYIGTFTKSLFPALRLGYVVVPHDLVPPFVAVRRAMDMFSPPFIQASSRTSSRTDTSSATSGARVCSVASVAAPSSRRWTRARLHAPRDRDEAGMFLTTVFETGTAIATSPAAPPTRAFARSRSRRVTWGERDSRVWSSATAASPKRRSTRALPGFARFWTPASARSSAGLDVPGETVQDGLPRGGFGWGGAK